MNLYENIKKNLKESEDEIKNFYYDSLLGERRQVPSRKQYEEEISKLPNLEDYADVSYEGFIHSLADSGVITDEEAEKYLSEAANPANEEKNKIIRQALKGPKGYEKNKEALEKMGIKGGNEYEPGETIYLRGPNGRSLSVDPDGTNVWRTYGDSRKHYKKELSFKNRHSKHYTGWDTLDYNSKRGEDFDYYNYLNKPENEYQEEVDQANRVKDFRDNKGKAGYNLPDNALTPEEKSLNKRPRKYVQLSKDRKELEDELAGYDETKKNLDKVNKEIKNLHK